MRGLILLGILCAWAAICAAIVSVLKKDIKESIGGQDQPVEKKKERLFDVDADIIQLKERPRRLRKEAPLNNIDITSFAFWE